jgi:folate-binding protein YgfZ
MANCVIECSGIGARAFLQGQLTCNINDLKENTPQITACCNLQGRVIFITYVIMKNDKNFLLLISETIKKIVFSHLEKYAKFSKCTLSCIDAVGATDWPPSSRKQDILNGIPNIYPETSEKIIAQRLNLHLIDGAISFKKGCYLGQEIISRLYFKGKLKHHMYLGTLPNTAFLSLGGKILNDLGEDAGIIVDYYVDQDKILLLFVNAVENNHPKIESDQEISPLPLPYSFKDETL